MSVAKQLERCCPGEAARRPKHGKSEAPPRDRPDRRRRRRLERGAGAAVHQIRDARRACRTQDRQAHGAVARNLAAPDIVVFNASYRTRGPLIELDPVEVEKSLMISCYGGFLVGQAAARQMLSRGSGSILFTGASASVKGYVNSAPF